MAGKLSHFDAAGQAHMVDVSGKEVTARIARAEAYLHIQPHTMTHVLGGTAKKGDVLGTARLAGIMAAKRTADLIPLCHPLPITKVSVELEPDQEASRVHILATVKTTGQTGVEMEALTAASVAGLTLYDMLKAVDKEMRLEGLRVVLKDGGASSRYEAP
ncbi:MAG: cyclic pyranopterin monophosphate synthase MoaC [Pseudomonadota bacterium]